MCCVYIIYVIIKRLFSGFLELYISVQSQLFPKRSLCSHSYFRKEVITNLRNFIKVTYFLCTDFQDLYICQKRIQLTRILYKNISFYPLRKFVVIIVPDKISKVDNGFDPKVNI